MDELLLCVGSLVVIGLSLWVRDRYFSLEGYHRAYDRAIQEDLRYFE